MQQLQQQQEDEVEEDEEDMGVAETYADYMPTKRERRSIINTSQKQPICSMFERQNPSWVIFTCQKGAITPH